MEEMNHKQQAEIIELKKRLEQKDLVHEVTVKEIESLRAEYMNLSLEKVRNILCEFQWIFYLIKLSTENDSSSVN